LQAPKSQSVDSGRVTSLPSGSARAHNALLSILGIEFRLVDDRQRAAPAVIKVPAHGKLD